MKHFSIIATTVAAMFLFVATARVNGQSDRQILVDEFKRRVAETKRPIPPTENSAFRRQAEKLQAETQRLEKRGTALLLDGDAHAEELRKLKTEALAIKTGDIGSVAKLRGIMRKLDDLSRRMDENRLAFRKLNDDFKDHLNNLRDLNRRIRAARTK